MADVKVPALLHKMSVSSQKAWYNKHNMALPGHLTGGEGKSAAQAKKDVGEINKAKAKEDRLKVIAAAAKKVAQPSSERVRAMRQNADQFGGGLGGGLDRNRDIMSYVRSGGYIKAGRLGEETSLDEEKDDREYGYEGDMAMSQLKSIIANSQKMHDMLEPDTDLPEWVQSKITLAEDYIVTAANYLQGEMNEESVNEGSGGKTPETETEENLAKKHGDPKKITYGDVIKARIESAKNKALKKGD